MNSSCTALESNGGALLCWRRNDGDWHHIAFTWTYETGEATLYFDGKPAELHASTAGALAALPNFSHMRSGDRSGDAHISPKTVRSSQGAHISSFSYSSSTADKYRVYKVYPKIGYI